MRILLTGASGFIAGHLIKELAPRHELIALARRIPESSGSPSVRWIQHDLTDPLEAASLPPDVDAIVHLAQSRHYKQFPEEAVDIFGVNVDSTFRLLEYARRASAKAFVFASSGGVYGSSHKKLVETDPVRPLDFYAASKYAAELLVWSYSQLFRTIILRLFFVYGPGQKGMLIPNLLDRVRDGRAVTIEGRGLRINPIHVRDVVNVFEPALALDRSDLFNVAGDEAVDLAELVRLIGKAAGRPVSIEHVTGKRDGDLVGDNSRMKEILGVVPRTSLAEGLASML